MQASQRSSLAAAQGLERGVEQDSFGATRMQPQDALSTPRAFFTADYFDALRPERQTQLERGRGVHQDAWGVVDQAEPSASELASGLAHDAGNLLSALSLYSELLAYPEVLGAKHRHYAADLKLLAERSGKLIDRLVEFGAEVDGARQRDFDSAANLTGNLTGNLIGNPTGNLTGEERSTGGVTRLDEGVDASVLKAASAPRLQWIGLPTAADRHHRNRVMVEDAVASLGVAETSNLVDVIVACGGVLSTLAGGALEVTMGSQAGLPIAVRREALERILVNLVKNAALAVRGGGSIRIQAGVAKHARGITGRAAGTRRMALTVDDSGCGMSAAKLTELKDGARRSGAGRSNGSRRGIGLRVVRELVEASGGSLSIESREGVGTRVKIEWPTASTAASVPAQLRAASSGLRPAAVSGEAYSAGLETVNRMEMVDEAELTAEERRMLMKQSNRPVLPAEAVLREAATHTQSARGSSDGMVEPAMRATRSMRAGVAADDRDLRAAESHVVDGASMGTVSRLAAQDATLDRSFAGSLQRSLDRERQRQQQGIAAENEGAIAC